MTAHESTLDPGAVIAGVEGAAGAAIFAASPGHGAPVEQAPSAAEAVRAAAARAWAGQRAGALLEARELLEALPAIGEAAAARAPITVHVVTRRGDGAVVGLSELAPALEVGAGALITWSAQDAADIALVARRAAEDSETPFLHFADAPRGAAMLPDAALAAKFLGAERPPPSFQDAPEGDPDAAARAVRRKRAERSYAGRAPFALASALRELGELTGRHLAAVERHDTSDAEEIVLAVGSAFPAAREVVRALREQGRKIGLVGPRALRPFYAPEMVKVLGRSRAVVVLEPLDVALAPSGPVAACVKAAFADALTWAPGFPGIGRIPPILSATFATVERGVTERDVRVALAELSSGERARRVVVFGSDA